MFEKKDIVFHESLGVCEVADVQKLSADKKTIYSYYYLKSVKDKSKTAYVPVENHRTLIRPLISPEEAKRVLSKEGAGILEKEEAEYVLKESAVRTNEEDLRI